MQVVITQLNEQNSKICVYIVYSQYIICRISNCLSDLKFSLACRLVVQGHLALTTIRCFPSLRLSCQWACAYVKYTVYFTQVLQQYNLCSQSSCNKINLHHLQQYQFFLNQISTSIQPHIKLINNQHGKVLILESYIKSFTYMYIPQFGKILM